MFKLIFTDVVLLMNLFIPFLESSSTSKCSKFISLEQELGLQKWNRGLRSLNKTHEGIIKVTTQFPDGSPIKPKGVLSK
jgi:hypothetical protein